MRNSLVLIILLFITIIAFKQDVINANTFDNVGEITVYDGIYLDKEAALRIITDNEVYNDMKFF